jgi:hypothetical protein
MIAAPASDSSDRARDRVRNGDLITLLRRNATVIQAAFATLWAVRLAATGGPWEIPIGVGLIGYLAARSAFGATSGVRGRDLLRTDRAKQFLRPVTRATVTQLVASGLLPVVASAIGAAHWSLPLIAASIGAFLIVFGRQLEIPAVTVVGVGYTVAALVVPLVVDRGNIAATASALSATALLVSTVVCSRSAGRSLR